MNSLMNSVKHAPFAALKIALPLSLNKLVQKCEKLIKYMKLLDMRRR